MNNLYFACTNCKVFVDAGCRWAYWTLEHSGIVKRGEEISTDAILSSEPYWNPGREKGAGGKVEADLLYRDVLPSVRLFLKTHRDHEILFGESEDFFSLDDESFLEWKQLGYLLVELPRYFVEELGHKTWDEVCEYMEQQMEKPWWWKLEWDDRHQKVRKKFESLVLERQAG